MDPIAVLLNNVPVKFVGCESCELPPSVSGSEPPGPSSDNSQVAKVLEELGFVDLSDSVSSNRDEMSHNSVSIEEEHGAKCPYCK